MPIEQLLLSPFNRWFRYTAGGERRPLFFDIDRTAPALRALDRAFPAIREEVLALLPDRHTLPQYHELDAHQYDISAATPSSWRIFYLYSMGEKPEANRARCPRTAALLDGIPNLFQAFFSILEAGKSVPAHEGPFLGYLRYHLPLLVPEADPPTLRLGDRHHTWKEGESLLFDDSWEHEVINRSTSDRVVLIVDILRPMPLPQHLANRVIAQVSRYAYARRVLRNAASP